MSNAKHTTAPSYFARSRISKILGPLSAAMLRGENPAPVVFEGYTIKTCRAENSSFKLGYCGGGPAWFVHFDVCKNGEYPFGGSRSDTENALWHRLNKDYHEFHKAAVS